jgi:hypothetical protein
MQFRRDQMVRLATIRQGSRAIVTAANAADENSPPRREGELSGRRRPAANFAMAAAIPNARAPVPINSSTVNKALRKSD